MSEWGKPSEAAAAAVVWGLLEAEAKARKDAARAHLQGVMGPDLRAVDGVVNGKTVGKASLSDPKSEFRISDYAAFNEFVAEHYPTEVATEVVTTVNSAFKTKLLAELKAVAGTIVDENGLPVPGVILHVGKPTVTVTKAKDVRDTVGELLSGGLLSLDAPKELKQ